MREYDPKGSMELLVREERPMNLSLRDPFWWMTRTKVTGMSPKIASIAGKRSTTEKRFLPVWVLQLWPNLRLCGYWVDWWDLLTAFGLEQRCCEVDWSADFPWLQRRGWLKFENNVRNFLEVLLLALSSETPTTSKGQDGLTSWIGSFEECLPRNLESQF